MIIIALRADTVAFVWIVNGKLGERLDYRISLEELSPIKEKSSLLSSE